MAQGKSQLFFCSKGGGRRIRAPPSAGAFRNAPPAAGTFLCAARIIFECAACGPDGRAQEAGAALCVSAGGAEAGKASP